MNQVAHEHGHLDHPHVDTNPWPPVGALGLVMMAFGLALSFHFKSPGLGVLVLGAVITIVGTVGWWRDLIQEAETHTLPTAHAASDVHRPGQDMRLAMILFIASEVMFFAAFFGFYFYTRAGQPAWPPAGTPHVFHSLLLPGIQTIILVASSFTYTLAEHAILRDNRRGLVVGLAVTLILGLIFLGGQAYEWSTMELTLRSGLMGTAFFMLTGFHGMHVIVGAIFIAVNLVRSIRGHFTKSSHFALQGAGWYWHFVDVIWLILFFLVLYLPVYNAQS
ncbi:MAG TPA: cytochrome c oxidase subunit 3 [Stenomitos sp.]